MANDYYDNSAAGQRFQAGVTARGSEVDDKFDQVQQGFAKLPGVASSGKGFDEPVHVGNATAGTHAVPLEQALDKVAEWVNASIYDGSTEYSFSDIVIGSDGLTYRFVGGSPATGDDPVTSDTGNWAGYGGGGVAELGTLTASMTNGQTTSINLSDEVVTPIVTATKEVIDTGLTNSDWNVDATGSNYEIEDSAYATTLTPSGTTGAITLALGAGAFDSDDVGKRIVGNSGEAVLTATDGSAEVTTDFASTATIASGSWQMYGLKTDGELAIAGLPGAFDSAKIQTGQANDPSVAAFPSGSFLVAYDDDADTGKGKFIIYDNQGVVEVAETAFDTASINGARAVTLSDGNVLVAYAAGGNLKTVVIDSSGTVSAIQTITSTNGFIYDIALLNDGNIFILYALVTSADLAFVIVQSGGTVVAGPTTITSTDSYQSATLMSSNDVGVVYKSSTDGFTKLVSYNASGTQTLTETTIISLSNSGYPVVCRLGSNIMVAYDMGFTAPGALAAFQIYDNSGTVVQAETTVGAERIQTGYAIGLSSGKAVVMGKGLTSNELKGYMVNSDGTVYAGPFTVYSSTQSGSGWLAELSNGNIAAAVQEAASPFESYIVGISAVGNVGSAGSVPTNQYFPAITNSIGQIDTEFWSDINSFTATETLNGQSAYYAVSTDNRLTWQIAKTGASPRPVARNNAGTWQYNADNTYANITWTNATINTEYGALSQAMSITASQMTGTQAGALGDADIPATGNTLDLAIILFTNAASGIPSSDGVSINYDANAVDTLAVPGTDYEWDRPDSTTVRLTSLGNFNIKARVVG